VKLRDLAAVLRDAAHQWWLQHDTFLHAAAISYCAVFALAPLVVIAVAIAGIVFGPDAAKGELANQIEMVTGETIARAIQDVIKNAHASGTSRTATIVSIVLLLLGARALFLQLQQALNGIWGVQGGTRHWLLTLLRARFLTYVMVLLVGLVLVAALIANTVLNYLGDKLPLASVPGGSLAWQGLHWAVSLALLTLLFAFMFKVLPEAVIPWRVVWLGAIITAMLFKLGNSAIELYLIHSTVASAFGAAGSLVVVLAWVYYSSQVVLFGAELTEASARRFGFLVAPPEAKREQEPAPVSAEQ
jgi:membrane protein